MAENMLKLFSIADMVAASDNEVCSTVLSSIYGIGDPILHGIYDHEIARLGLDRAESLEKLLNLLPVSAIIMKSLSGASKSQWVLSYDLEEIMDMRSFRKLVQLRDDDGGVSDRKEFAYEKWDGLRVLKEWGQQYFFGDVMSKQSQVIGSSYLEGRHLVLAHAKGSGVFVGSNVQYYGRADISGFQRFSPGWVFHGPKVDLEPGTYVLDVDLKPSDHHQRLKLDVAANEGLTKLLELEIVGEARFSMLFVVGPSDRRIEVRCVNDNGRDVLCDVRRVTFGAAV